ncbi:hypothetical protein CEN46_08210 [Fischerella thermalis CCMEE 5318]|uniref:Uncharacterized protein n=1 Tax=Fischerella thermalis CCMEE 5318 TaxID=2019666 RepID=A0A2N6LIW8_9CYAN|nr:hypothetical protein CEN46_08210 [Fischerella thermalis CCMEE 5318]
MPGAIIQGVQTDIVPTPNKLTTKSEDFLRNDLNDLTIRLDDRFDHGTHFFHRFECSTLISKYAGFSLQ